MIFVSGTHDKNTIITDGFDFTCFVGFAGLTDLICVTDYWSQKNSTNGAPFDVNTP